MDQQEWPHDFTLRITYSINASSLKMTAEVRAPTEDIEMALLFHTYLRVGHIKGTEIIGLQGLNYRPHAPDHAAETLGVGESCFEQREVVTIAGPTDRVYLDHAAGRILEVIDTAGYVLPATCLTSFAFVLPRQNLVVVSFGYIILPCYSVSLHGRSRKITVSNSNLPDCTVWNPWVEGARDFGDMPDDGYKQFVCVENGQTGQIAIPKGGMWTSSVTLTAGGLTPGDARL
jgi:D-hexose-6-phosphate mutarotase